MNLKDDLKYRDSLSKMHVGGIREKYPIDEYTDPLVEKYLECAGGDMEKLSHDSLCMIQGDMCRNCNSVAVLKLVKYPETDNVYLLCHKCRKNVPYPEKTIKTYRWTDRQLRERTIAHKRKWHRIVYGGQKP